MLAMAPEDQRMFPWFALQVRTKAEPLVEQALRGKAYETFLPTYIETRQYSDRIKKVETALFPGYLFCRLDPEQRLPILTTPGVHKIVSVDNNGPTPVDASEIEAIQRLLKGNGNPRPFPYLKVGDRVRVEVGAFAGVVGNLVSEKGVDRLIVSVTILHRSVAVEIDRTWLRPA